MNASAKKSVLAAKPIGKTMMSPFDTNSFHSLIYDLPAIKPIYDHEIKKAFASGYVAHSFKDKNYFLLQTENIDNETPVTKMLEPIGSPLMDIQSDMSTSPPPLVNTPTTPPNLNFYFYYDMPPVMPSFDLKNLPLSKNVKILNPQTPSFIPSAKHSDKTQTKTDNEMPDSKEIENTIPQNDLKLNDDVQKEKDTKINITCRFWAFEECKNDDCMFLHGYLLENGKIDTKKRSKSKNSSIKKKKKRN